MEQAREREYYIDWLRILAVLLLIPFHSAMIFVEWGFHVKAATTSQGLTHFNSFLGMWQMPLLMFLSGAGSWFALGFRSGGQYVKERLHRLFMPLLLGVLVIVPPQTYFERLQKGQFEGSYLAFYPHVFNGFYPEGNFTWNHLWFLAYLFIFSMMALPLLLWLRSARGKEFLDRSATFFDRGLSLLLLAIPLMLIRASMEVAWPGPQNFVSDWARLAGHFTIFVYGFCLCSRPGLRDAVARKKRWFLAIGFGLVNLFLILDLTGLEPDWGYNLGNMAFLALRGLNTWCWVLAILGYGRTFLQRTNRLLKYAVEAALPFYVLHQTVIIAIGYYVVQWQTGIMIQFVLIMLASLVGTVAIYDLFVKRIAIVRFLFGMRRA
jgi:hypothetical protein